MMQFDVLCCFEEGMEKKRNKTMYLNGTRKLLLFVSSMEIFPVKEFSGSVCSRPGV